MKYNCEISLKLPRKTVIELFDNPDNLSKWQTTLISFEHQSGEPGQPGAKSLLKYKMRNGEVEMVETILKRNLPDEFSATYEAKGVMNWVYNYFIDNGESTTWKMETEFKFSGFMAFMSIFMGGAFRKQTLKSMNQFKDFAESN